MRDVQISKEIQIDGYVSEDEDALNEFISFDRNKFIIKGTPGIGGTSAIINHANRAVIVIEPLKSIVRDKMNSYRQHNHDKRQVYFAVSEKKGKSSFLRQMSNNAADLQVYVCTPDSLLTTIDNGWITIEELKNIPIFFDEVHMPLSTAGYRKKLARLMDIIYSKWEANITLSSATIVYHFLDIPPRVRKELELIRVAKKDYQPLPLRFLTDNKNYYLSAISENVEKGEKQVVFTNTKSTIRQIVEVVGRHKVQFLTSVDFLAKIAPFATIDNKDIDDAKNGVIQEDKQVFILSSAYDTGFDFPYDAHVMVFARQYSKVDSRTYMDIFQSYGRVRGNRLSSDLVIRSSDHVAFVPEIIESETQYCHLNFENIERAVRLSTYSLPFMGKRIKEAGYELFFDRDFLERSIEDYQFNSNSFKDQLISLMDHDFEVLSDLFENVYQRFSLKGYGGTNIQLVTTYALAFVLKRFKGNSYITDKVDYIQRIKTIRRERELHKVFLFLYVNDPELRQALNPIYTPSDDAILRVKNAGGEVRGGFGDELIWDTNLQAAIHIIIYAYCLGKVDKELGLPTPSGDEKIYAEQKVKIKKMVEKKFGKNADERLNELYCFRSQCFNTTYFGNLLYQIKDDTIKLKVKSLIDAFASSNNPWLFRYLWNRLDGTTDKQLFENHHHFTLSKLLGLSGESFGVNEIDYREYNPSTKCARYLRYDKSPYRLVEFDLRSANAQYVDSQLGSSIAFDVYDNIMEAENCDRDVAKVKFNSALNSTYMGIEKKKKFFINSCGYTEAQASLLADITSKKDDEKFFYGATRFEKKIIDEFTMNNYLEGAWVRVHDAVIIPQYRAKENTYGLDHFGLNEHY